MNKLYKSVFATIFVVLVAMIMAWLNGIGSFIFAWTFHFMLMTVVLFISELTKAPLTSSYFSTKPWEKDGQLYEWFGVNIFRKVLVWVGWEKMNKKSNTVKKTSASLKQLEQFTRQAEFGHTLIFIIVCILCGFIILLYNLKTSFWLLLLNIPFHVYPVIVQRYNRPRFQKTLDRLENGYIR